MNFKKIVGTSFKCEKDDRLLHQISMKVPNLDRNIKMGLALGN